ncbi:MAG: PAC2 family protein [Acidimicrobiia bacterium]|nr:PAC2 family protein [Acidimicrobiia bacterium]MYG59431.1 PAC2 family protein [Acidimicrobiia bacterium]MYJ31179.1 PAC2 family protein [Acidimicrobiia bacterium]
MSSELVIVHREFDLADPVLVVALDGWVDAGFGMRNATEIMVKADDAALVASFDADLLVDHRARRPTMTVREGRVDDISWPAIRLQQVSDLDQRPFLVLHGPEPDFRWQAFCTAVDELVQRLGVSRVVALGAYPAAVPHTRPVRLSATGTSQDLIERFGSPAGTLEVPAGISAALAKRFEAAGLETVSVWAQVPHYASGSPFPAATAALFQGLRAVADLRFDPAPLIAEGLEVSRRLDTMIAQNSSHKRLLGQLESAYDTSMGEQGEEIPTGDELAEELERFLRDQDESK